MRFVLSRQLSNAHQTGFVPVFLFVCSPTRPPKTRAFWLICASASRHGSDCPRLKPFFRALIASSLQSRTGSPSGRRIEKRATPTFAPRSVGSKIGRPKIDLSWPGLCEEGRALANPSLGSYRCSSRAGAPSLWVLPKASHMQGAGARSLVRYSRARQVSARFPLPAVTTKTP